MTPLVWLSLGLGTVFFLAIAGIPLWYVVRHKEWGSHHHDGTSISGPTPQRAEEPEPEPAELAGIGGRSGSDGA